MFLGILTILTISSQWINCENLSTLNVINLKSLKKIEITEYKGAMNQEVFSFFQHITELEVKNSEFTLDNNFLHVLPRLRKLTMTDNRITTTGSNVTDCCEHLTELRLVNNHMKNLRIDQIGKVPYILLLVLTGEDVPVLKKEGFSASPRIKEMNITYSGLTTIEAGAFKGLQELETLNLEGNRLTHMTREILEPLKVLQKLVLKNNLLGEFSGDAVLNLDWLQFIDISHNPIKKLAIENIRNKAIRLKKIDVTGIDGTTQEILKFRE
ncbi:insulin-like growth factor-binding protein complex acid labile subunit [Coccinella septempunctata]|uniref:insulin-like growth factor-binding protein complex acid labile subunit n=1 Tax=Coccinella septempunctata TaxID=41139 RepID=UPI001D06D13B|nr:insulin-like growth factor-binding protein complex acid labile subunit [Coccinella septempunctata]